MTHARARKTDPETSHAAARSIEGIAGTQRRMVLDALREMGEATDDEINAACNRGGMRVSLAGSGTRRNELVKDGIVVDSGKRKRTSRGRMAIVWKIREEAKGE